MNQSNIESIPWVEKYRPSQFDDIVLDPLNRNLFKNIIEKNYFPNLLFYGPPGTGKTTTIINLINEYQTRYNKRNKSNVIHLNASDERGIDIIRNQINQFVKSMNLFETGLKFVILDEVDYMTKNAQHALKYLLQTSTYNVRFCLICNYISKIDESLKNEFISVRFNQLPKIDIYNFLKIILTKENIELTDEVIDTIQKTYNSDIRSMINFIQLNQNLKLLEWNNSVINTDILNEITLKFKTSKNVNPALSIQDKEMYLHIHNISIQYNIDKKTIINVYFNHIIRNQQYSSEMFIELMDIIQKTLHCPDANIEYIINYFCIYMKIWYSKQSGSAINNAVQP
jgi:replication factor C subunit 3/5